MDFVNKAFAQLSDLFKSMTPGARITTGLLLLVVVISLAFLFQHQTSAPDAYLMGGEPFAPSQFGAMEAAFHKAGLKGYEFDGSRVKVPRGQQAAYMAALADEQALPPSFGSYLGKAISGTNPFMGRDQREQMLKVAKQNELQFIIGKMKGIETASVLYDIQSKKAFGQDDVITASVNVKPVGSQPLDSDRVRVLRHLVASAIAGLKPETVTVTDLNGNVYPGSSGANGGLGSDDDKYANMKKIYDKVWETKLASALMHIPGVVVTVNAELDVETEHEENHTEFDPKAVAVESRETTGEKTMESGPPAGAPGTATNTSGSNTAAKIGAIASTKNNDTTTQTESRFAVPHTQKRTRQHGLTPKRVTATVGIPSNYYEKIWREQNPPADGQPAKPPTQAELTKIANEIKINVEKTVVNLLPPSQLDKFPLAVVETFQSIAPPTIPQPAMQDHALAWLGEYWTTIGTAGLALFSLAMLRSMVKSAPVSEPNSASAVAAAASGGAAPTLNVVADDDADEPGEQSARSRLKRRGAHGPSLRDELADIVKEDPDAAVNILRTWIGNAS